MEHFSATSVRVCGCLGYATAVLAILYWDQVDSIGIGLGIVMMAMIGLFLAAAVTVGLSMRLRQRPLREAPKSLDFKSTEASFEWISSYFIRSQ